MSKRTADSLKCPRCGSVDKQPLGENRFKCKNCELVYTEAESNSYDNYLQDEQQKIDDLTEDGNEDSQADGLMTLGDDDILLPEEF